MRKRSFKNEKKSPFRSFRRSYKEEFIDTFEPPRLLELATETLKVLNANKKTFLKIILSVSMFAVLFIGLLDEETLTSFRNSINTSNNTSFELGNFVKSALLLASISSTAGLSDSASSGQILILIFIFITLWLATIFIIRRFKHDGKKTKMRDALYNALTPFISTLIMFFITLIDLIPVLIVKILCTAAIKTDFLSMPFYALIFFIVSGLLILLSLYLVSASIIALTATSAPGVYPLKALESANELIFGRRIKFIVRLLYLIVIDILIYVITMIPVILIDTLLKSSFAFLSAIPFISFCLFTITCFIFIYSAAYIYLYYIRMLNHESK